MSCKFGGARTRAFGFCSVCAVCFGASTGLSQDTPAPEESSFTRLTITQGLIYNDNPNLSTTPDDQKASRTDFDLALRRATRSQAFEANFSGRLELGDTEFQGFQNPSVELSYSLDRARASLLATAEFSESDVSSLVASGSLDDDALVVDRGKRQLSSLSLNGILARDYPVSLQYAISTRDTRYRDTLSTSLIDSTVNSASATANFRINPALTGRVTSQLSETDFAPGGQDRTFSSFGVGATYELASATQLSFDVNQTRIELANAGQPDTVQDGFGYSFGLVQDVSNGNWSFNLQSSVGENGRRNFVQIGRAVELPLGDFSASFGLNKTEGFDVRPVWNASYAYELPRTRYSANLTQAVGAGSTDSSERLTSTLRVAAEHQLTDLSKLDFGASLRRTDTLDDIGSDQERVDFSVSYSRTIARNVVLVGGYSAARAKLNNDPSRAFNQVFLQVRTVLQR